MSNAWVSKLRHAWVCLFTLFFILNLDQFGFATGIGPAPKYWIAASFAMTLLLFAPRTRTLYAVRLPICIWAVAYLLVSVLWFWPADSIGAALEGYSRVVICSLFVFMAVFAYSSIEGSRLWEWTLWIALCSAVLSIQHEYNDPGAYLFADAGLGIVGRAAGLYLNPNIAAQAVVMILACLLNMSSRKWGAVAVAIAFLGVLPTYSRGGLVAWAFLVIVATWRGRLPRAAMLFIVLAGILVVIGGDWLFALLADRVSPDNKNVLDRLAWLLGQGNLADTSVGARQYVASVAWNRFLEAPVVGHGLGAMWNWTAQVGTHNMVLRFMVEYGFAGAVIFPAFLIMSVTSSPRHVDRRWLWMVAAVGGLLSLASHNMTEQPGFLLPWLALCLGAGVQKPRARRGA